MFVPLALYNQLKEKRYMLPKDYVERVYAGFLGMNIGIRLGAPVEPELWSYERILATYGDIRGYVKDYKHFAADDDANGPVFFLRALDDNNAQVTPQAVGEAWLNYAREGVGLYWWGGYGVSTEHTAYLNLKHGIPAPQSGSVKQNGKILAEQIGGQIFIDTWGLIAPSDPARAADYAVKAASVSHDGEGLHGAAFMAACIAKAFDITDVGEIVKAGLAQIPADSLYAAVVCAVRDFYQAQPGDWRACRGMLARDWGYDKYTGVCHIIPNAGVCALALFYGAGDFARTVEIATMCSWDTDCNAGNVGTILGVACGLAGLPAHYLQPINDEIVLSGISGYLNILDIPTYAYELAAWGYRLAGQDIPEAVQGRLKPGETNFDFSLPGSTHGMRFVCDVPTCTKLSGGRVLLDRMVRGQQAKYFYKPFWRREDFSDERYMPVFSPRAYPGQRVQMVFDYDKLQGEMLLLIPYARESLTGREFKQTPAEVKQAQTGLELAFTIPGVDGGLIDEIGVIIESAAPGKFALSGELALRSFRIYGAATYDIDVTKTRKEFGSILPFSHNHGAWGLEGGRIHVLCEDGAQAFTGNYYMADGAVTGAITLENGESAVVALRAQGAVRGYYAGLHGTDKIAILRQERDGLTVLAQAEYAWQHGRTYQIRFAAKADALSLCVDGVEKCTVRDGAYSYGMTGYALMAPGRAYLGSLKVEEE